MLIKTGSYRQPEQFLLDVRDFRGGYNSLVDEARLPSKFATAATNLMQDQDGLWRTRWGRDYFGSAISGEDSLDGATEFIKSDGSRELIAVGGTTGKIYKSTNDGANWSQIGSKTLTPGNDVHFLQLRGELYIANGVDNLLRYDGTSLNEYSQLSAPTGLTLSRGSGLSSGDYTYYYQVTAVNEVGETTPCAEQSITVNKERENWDSTSNEYIDLSWNAVSGAKRYYVYMSDESGWEVFLAETTDNSLKDDGTLATNDYIEPPDDNTTAAPKFTSMEASGNRIWATGDPNSKYRVYFSGAGINLGKFSVWYGGGWVDLEKGGRYTPVAVVHYRTGKGDPVATVLCSSPEGTGAIWQVELSAITVNEVAIIVPAVYKIVGSIGANAPLSVVKARDNIFFINRRGVFALRNKEQMFNVLATDELSQGIRPDFRGLKNIEKAVGYYYDGKVFFSASEEGGSNNIIFIFDLERGNWTWKWDFGVKRFFEYTDSNGNSHFLYVPTNEGRLVEISENFIGDFGEPFYQLYLSPLLPVSKDRSDVAKIKEAIIELGRPRGNISFEILGIGPSGTISVLSSRTIADTISYSGLSYDLFSDFLLTDTNGTPETYSLPSVKKVLNIRKKVYNLQFKVWSNSGNTAFALLGLQAKGILFKKRAPAAWRN